MTAPEAEKPRIDVDPEKASTNFYWLLGTTEVFNLQTTIRGNLSDEEISSHMRSAVAAMKQALALGGHAKAVGKNGDVQTFVAPTTPAQAAIETGKAAPEPVGQPAPQGALSKAINIIKVLPQPGDKVNVEFWQTGRKYAELYAKGWSLDRVRNLLSTVTKHDPAKPAELPLNCTVTYTLGKEYKPGKHYEDVQAIYPA